MNKQRKVLITITYNEMGIIIDTKAEDVAQPNLQQTCNQLETDCISRQAAIDAHCELCPDRGNCSDICPDVEVFKLLPSVQERKKGRWIEQEDYNLDTYYDCSVCGESWCTVDGTPWENGMNYCPHCGASMTKGAEE